MSFILIIIVLNFSCSSLNLLKINQDDTVISKTSMMENGDICKEEWRENLLHGTTTCWNKSNKIISRVNYKNGYLDGKWIQFYDNENVMYSINYSLGKKTGFEIWYYDNGSIQSKTEYLNNEIISEIIRWDNEGNIIE
tara:strand:+ start:255 stop:668 length:414 start_codon:yes stop_codon:yes gene_type:complete